jgi:hypothetical protein
MSEFVDRVVSIADRQKPDSDLLCRCGHHAFWHTGAAGTGPCVKCTCEVFRLEVSNEYPAA